jgi:hypothetical protein
MRALALLLVVALTSAPAAAQSRPSSPTQPSLSQREVPYGVGRATQRFELASSGPGPHFGPPSPAGPPRQVTIARGARADGRTDTMCPMPVAPASGDSAEMPRAAADSLASAAVPMPVVPGGCVNRLRRR